MTQPTLVAEARSGRGKGPARQLRRSGKVPGVVYGQGQAARTLAVSGAELEKALIGAGGSTVIALNLDGTTLQTLIREVQRHPTRLHITHIDFLEIHAGEELTVEVPIHLIGSPDGVRNQGGVLDQILREIEIRVLPKDIPPHLDVDVTDLRVGDSIHVSDIAVPNATILAEPTDTICTVIAPRVEVEPTPAEEEEEEVTEPELIRKPKAEDEGEGTERGD